MAKPKPFPYKAAGLVDAALMDLAEARDTLRVIMKNSTTREELYRLTGNAIDLIHEASAALEAARKIKPD